jgi:hypothetical protein
MLTQSFHEILGTGLESLQHWERDFPDSDLSRLKHCT